MPALPAAADRFLDVLRTHRTLRDLEEAAGAVHKEIAGSTPAEMTEALGKLLPCLGSTGLIAAGAVAVTCGAMVESGADPGVCGEAVLGRLPELLPGMIGFLAEVNRRAAATPGEAGLPQLIDQHLGDILKDHPELGWAYIAHRPLVMGAVAHLCKSKGLRAVARARPDLLQLSREVDRTTGQKSFLTDVLRVLDDERLVVLHPGEGKGFEVRIGGLADNFQLHALLADALVGDPAAGLLTGKKPDPAVTAAHRDGPVPKARLTAIGVWNLWHWPALEPGGTLPRGLPNGAWAVWHEGTPADLARFEGVRVLLLGPAVPARSWNAVRRFPQMTGELAVERVLQADEVRDRLARLAAAPKPTAPGA